MAPAFALAGAGLACFILVTFNLDLPRGKLDFDQIWLAARSILDGKDPYEVIGPPDFYFPLYYPLTSVVLALPLALLDFREARLLFVAIGGGLYGYGIGRHRPWLWPTFFGIPFILFSTGGQWSALISAALLLPWLGFMAVAKPNLGLALLAGLRSRKAFILLIGGSLAVLLASLIVDPSWPASWFAALQRSTHFRPLILRPGGVLMLLALLRWRDPDARLLLALAAVPTTGLSYDFLPAALVARTWKEAAILTVLTQIAWIVAPGYPVRQPYADWSWQTGIGTLWGTLAPALALVLWRARRPPLAPTGPSGEYSAGPAQPVPPPTATAN